MTVARALRSPAFIILSITFFACCATHSGPIFHTVSYATICGLPTMAAVSIYSVEASAGSSAASSWARSRIASDRRRC